jgi:hypothetical protein
MATELNFTARLDTSQFLSQVDQARTHFGMVFGGGMGGAGMNDVSGGISQAFQQMFAGMPSQPGGGFGQMFTTAMTGYNPNYGAVEATTSLREEWMVNRGGVAAANFFKPPGVSGGDWAVGVERNYIGRQLEAAHAANMAGQSAFFGGAASTLVGEIASKVATPIGAWAGASIATRFLGAGAAGAGGLVGGLAAGYLAFDKVGGAAADFVEGHFARIQKIEGITTELAELAGGGRGLNRSERTELGISAYKASRDIGMDAQEMGDVLSLGRQAGMLPPSTDPNKAREQYREFARSIEEGAQIIGGSLAQATAVVKSGALSGMGSQESLMRAAGAGGADAFLAQQSAMQGFAMQGMGVARSMGFTGAQGAGIFTSAYGSVGGGMSSEEMRIMGGRFGAAQFVGQTQMAMAKSPLGDLQMMAAMSGRGMGGMGLMDLPGAAMQGLQAGGGDFMSNVGNWMVHQNEFRRGIGASGIRAMAGAQLEMGGELIHSMMPGMSMTDSKRLYAQSMGMDPDQAKLMVGGPGGVGGMGNGMLYGQIARMDVAMENSMAGAPKMGALGGSIGGFGFGEAAIGGGAGMLLGPGVAVIGAVAGAIHQNFGAIKEMFSGPGLFASAQEKAEYYSREQASDYDEAMGAFRRKNGIIPINAAAEERFLASDMSGVRLDMDEGGGSQVASSRTAAMFSAMGLHSRDRGGAGMIKVGGKFWSATDVQRIGRAWKPQMAVSEADHVSTLSAATAASTSRGAQQGRINELIDQFKMSYETIRLGETPGTEDFDVSAGNWYQSGHIAGHRTNAAGMQSTESFGGRRMSVDVAGALNPTLARREIAEAADPKVRAQLLAAFDKDSYRGAGVRSYLETFNGMALKDLRGSEFARRAGAVGMEHAEISNEARELQFLMRSYNNNAGDGGNMPPSYYRALQKNDHYLHGKELIRSGHVDEAKKELQIAAMDARSGLGAGFRDRVTPDLDPTKQHVRPGVEEAQAAAHQAELKAQWINNGIGFGAGTASVADKAVATQVAIMAKMTADAAAKSTTSLVNEVGLENKSGMAEKAKMAAREKRFGPGVIERAVGFGEQESAMQSILKSLKSTENSLAALDKRVSGISANPQPGAPVPPRPMGKVSVVE